MGHFTIPQTYDLGCKVIVHINSIQQIFTEFYYAQGLKCKVEEDMDWFAVAAVFK